MTTSDREYVHRLISRYGIVRLLELMADTIEDLGESGVYKTDAQWPQIAEAVRECSDKVNSIVNGTPADSLRTALIQAREGQRIPLSEMWEEEDV